MEVEALRANYDEAAKQARTAVKKDKISNLESLARTAEETHKDRDPRTVHQVIRRLAPPARLPTRTVRCIATGEPCRHKQHEMEEIEKAMYQIYKGTNRPLEWQAPCSSSTTAVWQAPDVAQLSRATKRLPNFKAAPKIFLGDSLADTSTAMTRGSVAELYKLGVDSLVPALAGCYKVLCETGSLPQALSTRLRKTKSTGENAAEDYRNISILENRGNALVGAQLQPLMRILQSNLDACQFGEGVVRRSTRDAIALADEILRRYRLHRRRQRLARRARVGQQSSQPCLAMTLFDLSKAFDLSVRADAWKAVGRLTEDASIEFFLEELHRGSATV